MKRKGHWPKGSRLGLRLQTFRSTGNSWSAAALASSAFCFASRERTVNARAETIDKAPSFRQAFTKRRCLIPADGFYEWRKTAKPKLPFAIAMKDGRPFTFAGLWENWKDPESGEWLRTCTIITGEPNELVAQIHPRMPVILPAQHHAAWLGETDGGNLKALLVPSPDN
jgi:putative SOS response-associated peptidase YedK